MSNSILLKENLTKAQREFEQARLNVLEAEKALHRAEISPGSNNFNTASNAEKVLTDC